MVPLGSRLMATATVLEQDDKTYVGDFRLDTFVRDDAKVGEGQQVDWDETFKNIQDFASLIQVRTIINSSCRYFLKARVSSTWT